MPYYGDATRDGAILTWTPSVTGTYFLDVEASHTGSTPYAVQFSVAEHDDHGAAPGTAGMIAFDKATSGRFELPNDVDWYKVTLQAGVAYSFALQGVAEGSSTRSPEGRMELLDAAGGGLDTVLYKGSYHDYWIGTGNGALQVNALRDACGHDSLTGVERLVFEDRAFAFDASGAAGQLYRLYQATFGRTPDMAGIGYWLSRLDSGMSLHDVALEFSAGSEFKEKFGADPADERFVARLYENVLHRSPEQTGADYWADAMRHGITREEVLISFSESPENQTALIGRISEGIAYIPFS